MSSYKSTTATTSDAMHSFSALHGTIGLALSRRHATSSSATTSSTDDFPALTREDLLARDSLEIARRSIAHKRERRNAAAGGEDLPVLTPEDLPTRDSLEIARKNLAHKRERRNAALSAALSVVDDAADVINADDTTFGSPLVRTGRRNASVWHHYVPHKDSLDLARERATRSIVTKRCSLKQRVCDKVRTMVADTGAALRRVKSGCSLDGSKPEQDTSVEGRPRIEVLQHTLRKLA